MYLRDSFMLPFRKQCIVEPLLLRIAEDCLLVVAATDGVDQLLERDGRGRAVSVGSCVLGELVRFVGEVPIVVAGELPRDLVQHTDLIARQRAATWILR